MKNIKRKSDETAFFLTALVSIAAVILICIFLFASGIPAIKEIGVFKFCWVQAGNPQIISMGFSL